MPFVVFAVVGYQYFVVVNIDRVDECVDQPTFLIIVSNISVFKFVYSEFYLLFAQNRLLALLFEYFYLKIGLFLFRTVKHVLYR